MAGDTNKTSNAPSKSDGMATPKPKMHVMIDANVYRSGGSHIGPLPLLYTQSDGINQSKKSIQTRIYENPHYEHNDNSLIPNLIIVSTMDRELAHFGGYGRDEQGVTEKIFLNDDGILKSQKWKGLISCVETNVVSNPLRMFPMFSYDPRRYRYAEYKNINRSNLIKGCGIWKDPFARIVGHKHTVTGVKEKSRIWLGFCLNPLLGFRPFDELCDYLPNFYKECEDYSIPILAYCTIEEIRAQDAEKYKDMDEKDAVRRERMEKYKTWYKDYGARVDKPSSDPASDKYAGESLLDDEKFDHFYCNYGHPDNWRPVLRCFPKLHLCLSHFGGNKIWNEGVFESKCFQDNSRLYPEPALIRSIIELTREYDNVYVDISGLNLYDTNVLVSLFGMLDLIKECEYCDRSGSCGQSYKHLKNKLIFGSGWYMSDLYDEINEKDDYIKYCRLFKTRFDFVDRLWEKKHRSADRPFWEYLSLINPWNFYGLGKKDQVNNSKIKKMYDALKKAGANGKKLEEMRDLLIGDGDHERGC